MSSKYKSEFVANMSHELRTPGPGGAAREQPGNNTAASQVEYVSVTRSRHDLPTSSNDILDLAKVESGRVVTIDLGSVIDQKAQQRADT